MLGGNKICGHISTFPDLVYCYVENDQLN
jgi:hypothetical protein